MLAILLNLTYTNDIYMRTKKSLGSALRGFCMLSKGYDHSEPICTCSKLLTIRQFSLPNSDAFAVIDYKIGVYLSMHETRSAQSRRYFSPWSRPF